MNNDGKYIANANMLKPATTNPNANINEYPTRPTPLMIAPMSCNP